jgi:hypothetical protein
MLPPHDQSTITARGQELPSELYDEGQIPAVHDTKTSLFFLPRPQLEVNEQLQDFSALLPRKMLSVLIEYD